MILNFEYQEEKGLINWRFKAQNQQVKVEHPQLVKCYEYVDRVFVLTIENKTSVLYVYNAEGELADKIVSTKDFFISGFGAGVIDPEILIRCKGSEPAVYIYDVKKKAFKKDGNFLKGECS